nr:MAG TPA: hypothetical protein [Caudoviricetes sp.]
MVFILYTSFILIICNCKQNVKSRFVNFIKSLLGSLQNVYYNTVIR